MRLLEPRGEVRLRLAAIGDIGLIGSARAFARREGYDAALASLAPSLRVADLAFANLEFPVGEPGWVEPGRSTEFWHDAEVLPALARAGVGVVSIANNHTMDCGPRGVARTREACAAAGIAVVGAGEDLDTARAPARLTTPAGRVVVRPYDSGGRTDVSEILALSANYRIRDYLTLSAISTFVANQSNQSVFDYEVFNIGGGISLTWRF